METLVLGLYNPTVLKILEKNQVPYPKVNFVTKINNPQNSEMKILWKYEVDMLKIMDNYHRLYTLWINFFNTHIKIL
jgi:hypothetical protein